MKPIDAFFRRLFESPAGEAPPGKCRCSLSDSGLRSICAYCRRRLRHSFRRHSGLRFLVLLRDGYICVCCAARDRLNVHHRNGRKPDSYLWNLVCLCCRCHGVIERSKYFECRGRAGEDRLLALWKELNPGEYHQPLLIR